MVYAELIQKEVSCPAICPPPPPSFSSSFPSIPPPRSRPWFLCPGCISHTWLQRHSVPCSLPPACRSCSTWSSHYQYPHGKSASWPHSFHLTFPVSFPRGPRTDQDPPPRVRTKSGSVCLHHTLLTLPTPGSSGINGFLSLRTSHNGHVPSVDEGKSSATGSGPS